MTINVSRSLEHVFDLEENTTVLPPSAFAQVTPALITPPQQPDTVYDERDVAIQTDLDTIQSTAMALATSLQQTMEFSTDPRGIPRLGEVSIQALGAALDALKQKIDIKKHKDKLHVNGGVEKVVNTQNNTLVIDRNDLLKQLLRKK